MSEEKKKAFFARLGFGQSGDGGCGCPTVQIVSEAEVLRQEEEQKKDDKDTKTKTTGCCG